MQAAEGRPFLVCVYSQGFVGDGITSPTNDPKWSSAPSCGDMKALALPAATLPRISINHRH